MGEMNGKSVPEEHSVKVLCFEKENWTRLQENFIILNLFVSVHFLIDRVLSRTAFED